MASFGAPQRTHLLGGIAWRLLTVVYTPRGFILHAASLRQAFAHCGIFVPAASRRSLGSVSVPMWPVDLSVRLPVIALVGRYPTNKLMGHGPIPGRQVPKNPNPLTARRCLRVVSSSIAPPFGGLSSCPGYVIHALLTLPPRYLSPEGDVGVRLAWVSHAASVRSEPGSNPSLEYRSLAPRGGKIEKVDTGAVLPSRGRAKTQNPAVLTCVGIASRGFRV